MHKIPLLMLSAGVTALLGAKPAQAQSAAAPPQAAASAAAGSDASLAPVIVTASKKKQLTIDVPYAVTAIGAGDIRDRGVLDIGELQSTVPSLFITENGPGQSRIQLRGMSTIAGSPTVGEYLDDMSIDMDQVQRALDIPLVDMARIEVLRGPQGTLYGAGSLGGTIKFITRDPVLDKTEFAAETGFRSVHNGQTGYHANAIANLPIVPDTAGVRLVAGYEKMPGWVDNSLNGDKDINGGSRKYIRGKGLFRVNDQVTVSLLAYHYSLGQDNPTASNADYTEPLYFASRNADEFNLANFVVNADLGAATLTSSTGYIDRSLLQAADVTPYFSAALPPSIFPPGTAIGLRTAINYKIFTEELRLTSNGSGPLSWITGVFYRDSRTHQDQSTPSTATPPITFLDQTGTSPVNSKQYAAFGEVSYAIVPTVVVTGGLRYFTEDQDLSSTSGPTTTTESAKFHALSPRFNVLWRYAKDESLYANVAKGFRSGGFNTLPSPPSYGPETLWSYEVGGKGLLLSDKLQYDVAVYYSDYRNVQGLDVQPGALYATTDNTGKASGFGFDAALVAELAPGLSVDAALGIVNISYDVNTPDRDKGDPLNYIPKKTAAVGMTWRYQWPAISMPGMIRVDYQHTDATRIIARTAHVDAPTDAANYLNLRIGLEQPKWQVYLEGRNLTNFYGITNPAIGAITVPVRPEPRSLGVTLRAQF